MDDLAIICDEIMDGDTDAEAKLNNEAKSYDKTNFNEKKATCKTQNFYVLLTSLLISVELLIALAFTVI